jgi:Cys-tRNA(Pro)/Cys-tRNA(Cys) deacylase
LAVAKTNAMRILDAKKMAYDILTYENTDGKIDGISVAHKINRDPSVVFKTLIAQGNSKLLYVFIIPVEKELDLKKAAKAAGEKSVEMIPVKDIQKWTGYIRGGCSPIGMKKQYPTFIDQLSSLHENIIVSGGKIGIQIEISLHQLKDITIAKIADISK